MRAYGAGATDVGLQRDHNEDSFAVVDEQELFIVADGMGGHRAGDIASRMATETIVGFFQATESEDVTWPFHFDSNLTDEENRLLTGIRLANRQIVEQSVRSRDCQGMGTTVVGALFSPKKGKMFIGHVGDSRAYRVRGGRIELMTRDHSLLNEYTAAMPELTEEQRSELPKNVITRALGMQDQVTVDLQSDDVQPGDVYILCSDGLSGMVEEDELLGVLGTEVVAGRAVEENQDLRVACTRLIALANEHGGEDNVTAVVVKVLDDPDRRELSFSDTLPDRPELEQAAAALRASADVATVETADTPPAGVTDEKPEGEKQGQ